MWDFELWYVKTRQDELRQQVAACMAAPRNTGHRPPRRHHWLQRLHEFLAHWGLRLPARPTTHLAPAVVRVAPQKHGGSNVWRHR
jgi:hypothetical protein